MVEASVTLLVIYTQRLSECVAFYTDLGLPLVREQHGQGPVHYAAELAGGLVLELYPGQPERITGRLRLGFSAAATTAHPDGEHRLTDPDGRVVLLTDRDT